MEYLRNEALLEQYKKQLRLEERFSNLKQLPISLVRFAEGEPLYLAGSRMEQMFFVAEGRLKIYHISESGRQFTVTYEEAPAFLGDVEFLTDIPSVNHVEAAAPTLCLLLPMEQCRRLLRDDLLFYKFLCSSVVGKLVNMNQDRQQQKTPLLGRLAAYLLMLWQSGSKIPPLQEVSGLLNCSYRHLLRTLRELRDLGALRQEKKGSYYITNAALLEQLAQLTEE